MVPSTPSLYPSRRKGLGFTDSHPGANGATEPSEAIDALERSLILAAREEARGNKRQAARTLGRSLANLYAKLRKRGIAQDPAG